MYTCIQIYSKTSHIPNLLSWVFSETVKDLLFNWWNGLGKHALDIWNLVPLCLMWIVWLERDRKSTRLNSSHI